MALSRSARLQARTGAGHRAITSVPAPLQLTPGQLAPAALPSTTHASICQPAAHQIARSTDGSTPAARLWRTHRRAARCHAVLSEADSGPSAQVAAQTAIVYSAFTVSPGQTLQVCAPSHRVATRPCSVWTPRQPLSHIAGQKALPGHSVHWLRVSCVAFVQEMQAGLEQARLEDLPLSPAAIDALQATITPGALASLSHEQLASLLQSLAACTSEPLSTDCAASILNHTQDRIKSQLSEDDMRQLSSLLWAVSELGVQPSAEWLEVAAERLCTGAAAGSLFAQDLSTILCALGTMGYKTSSTTAPVIAKEIQVQVRLGLLSTCMTHTVIQMYAECRVTRML